MTTAIDILLSAYQALSPGEQETAFQRLADLRLKRQAREDDEEDRYLRALQRVTEIAGSVPSVSAYRGIWRGLKERGEQLPNASAVIRHFGSWRQAREAIELAETSTSRQIEARFAKRRLDKVWRYTRETLKNTIAACVRDLGHVPQVAEFEHWRRRELELARASGDDALHLPSAGPYRRRFGSWEKALLALGYTPDEIVERLDRSMGAQASGEGLAQA